MVISADTFLTERTLKPLSERRIRAYEARACEYVRNTFLPALELVSDAQLLEFVRRCYQECRSLGLKAERECFHYLNVAMHWGTGFWRDPQYADVLDGIGWHANGDDVPADLSIKQLLHLLVEHQRCLENDLQRMDDIRRRFYGVYTSASFALETNALLDFLEAVYPERFKLTQNYYWVEFANSVNRNVAAFKLEPPDIMTCIGLGVYFGHEFPSDPRFGWVRDALRDDGRALVKRRIALGEGVLAYLDALERGARQSGSTQHD